ncbi:hypothetical protein KC316_g4957 [Hortaea werneckii]|nr:hypothetical protein KC324_g5100 [Hortaea werneckii]KAI7587604.1 hypothetical protein KC316_g4957 [Hortaea werneckii]
MRPNPPTQTSPGTITIRSREPQDLLPLTHLLQTVYEQDAYPVQGTTHAREFLTQASTLQAWVAEASPSSSSSSAGEGEKVVGNGEEGEGRERGWDKGRPQIVGHIAVSRPREGDVAVRLWRELHPRRGAIAGGQEGKEGKEKGREQGEERTDEEEDDEQEGIAVLERLFIHPSARGQGLASSLLGTAEEWARTTTSLALSPSCSSTGDNEPNQQHQQKKQEPKEKEKKPGIRLLLFALAKDEPAMRLYRRRGWAEFGRTGFTWDDGPSFPTSRDGEEGEGGEKNQKKEMEAICFVSPLPPPSPTAVVAS